MKKIRYTAIPLFLLLSTAAQTDNPVLLAIKKEVDRNVHELKMEGFPPPFFIGYTITDLHQLNVRASFGAVTRSSCNRERIGYPFVLVGSYDFNNLKYASPPRSRPQSLSLENDEAGIGMSVWLDLDREYKQAAERFESKKGALRQMRLTSEEQALPDYEKTPAVNLILPPEMIHGDLNYWESFARTASATVNKYPAIFKSEVTVEIKNGMNYYYDSEGCRIAVPAVFCNVSFNARVMTDDGEELWGSVSCIRSSTGRLPGIETFMEACEKEIARLLTLKDAPLVEKSYSGPVLFRDEALSTHVRRNLFIHQLMASPGNINGSGGNELEMMTDEKIMSDQITVKSLSGTKVYRGHILDGYFPVDGEGVSPAEELVLIENGVLKNMLNGRTPTLKNQHSNGHNRFNFYVDIWQKKIFPGVILVTGKNRYAEDDMKRKLIHAAREAGLEYAYIIDRISILNKSHGATRIYVADGREEPVRGLGISRIKFDSFNKIAGMSDEDYFYTDGFTGVITTFIVPASMLFEAVELFKVNQSDLQAPFLVPSPTE